MAFFDKLSKAATNIGRSTLNVAVAVGSQASVAVQDQTRLAELKTQVNVIQQELDASYVQIGRKYVDYVIASGEMPGIDVSDILQLMDPKLTLKEELEKEIVELEKKIKSNAILREKQAAEESFLQEKTKLDRALAMDVITKDEYDVKLAIAQKKVDNFELSRKVEQQYDMQLISKEERDTKIRELVE
jgi:hypothetical protein